MATPVKIGSEFLVNAGRDGWASQPFSWEPSVFMVSDDQFMVSWTDRFRTFDFDSYDESDIVGQIFDTLGNKVGGEISIAVQDAINPSQSTGSRLESGSFISVWFERNVFGGAETLVQAAIYNSETGEFSDNLRIDQSQFTKNVYPSVAYLGDERFVVTWLGYENTGALSSERHFFGQIFDTNGNPATQEFLIREDAEMYLQGRARVTAFDDGNFAVVWAEDLVASGDTNRMDIYGSLYDANGNVIRENFLINETRRFTQWEPEVTSLSNGNFVVVWEDYSLTGSDIVETAVRAQIFGPDAQPRGDEFLVNTVTQNRQKAPSITALSDGRFVIAWEDNRAPRKIAPDLTTV